MASSSNQSIEFNVNEEEYSFFDGEVQSQRASCSNATEEQNNPDVLNQYEKIGVLGKGGYGKVYLVRERGGANEVQVFAMKKLRKGCDTFDIERMVSEKVSGYPFLVSLCRSFKTDSHGYLVMDYMEGGDLSKLIKKKHTLTEDEARFYLAEVLLAIETLHEMGIVHRDIKPNNILLDSDGHIALADYGLCKAFPINEQDKRTYTGCGTLTYMAPEIIKESGYGMAVDWWSFGILAYHMLVGYTPFQQPHDDNSKLSERILNDEPEMVLQFSPAVRDLMTRLLEKDPEKRLGCGKEGSLEIRNHPFFKGINWADVAKKAVPPPYQPVADNKLNGSGYGDQSSVELPRSKVTPSQKHVTNFKRVGQKRERGQSDSSTPRPRKMQL